LKSQFVSIGKVAEAVGAFATKMVESGYATTILANGVRVQICLQKGPEITVGYYHQRIYRAHTRLIVEYKTDPEITTATIKTLIAPLVAAIIIAIKVIAVAIAIGVGVGLIIWFNGISQPNTETIIQETIEEQYDPVTGKLVKRVIDRTIDDKTTNIWGDVIQNVAIVAVIVGGLITALVVLPKLMPSKKN
jgi:hypothetical protein